MKGSFLFTTFDTNYIISLRKLLHIKSSVFLLNFVFSALLLSCNNKGSNGSDEGDKNKEEDSLISIPNIEIKEEPPLIIKYQLDSLIAQEEVDSLFSTYNKKQQEIIFALNRIEPVRVGVGSNLIIPDTLLDNLLEYTPFPLKFNLLDSISKAVLINQRVQAFALYDSGNLIKWGPVSSGKQSTPTPNGLHYGNYKAQRKISTVNPDWILPYYFNFMNFEGVGVHQYLLPGYPASHACVRLYMDDATYIYEWANQWELDPKGRRIVKNGTPFMVFGAYNFEGEYPWLDLVKDPHSQNLNEQELKILVQYRDQYMQDEKNFVIEEDPSQQQEQ